MNAEVLNSRTSDRAAAEGDDERREEGRSPKALQE